MYIYIYSITYISLRASFGPLAPLIFIESTYNIYDEPIYILYIYPTPAQYQNGFAGATRAAQSHPAPHQRVDQIEPWRIIRVADTTECQYGRRSARQTPAAAVPIASAPAAAVEASTVPVEGAVAR